MTWREKAHELLACSLKMSALAVEHMAHLRPIDGARCLRKATALMVAAFAIGKAVRDDQRLAFLPYPETPSDWSPWAPADGDPLVLRSDNGFTIATT
jgi:hypothetical protein